MSHSILSIGEVLWDRFPDGPQFGGAPANFACHSAALGNHVLIFSAVGNDSFGQDALTVLRSFHVNTELIQMVPNASTGMVDVQLDAAGKPTFTIQSNSAWDHISLNSQVEKTISKVDAVYFGTLGQRAVESRSTTQEILKSAKARGIPRVLDVNLRKPYFDDSIICQSIELANILKISDEELSIVAQAVGISIVHDSETTLRSLFRHCNLDLIAMTMGAKGALLVSNSETILQPALPTQIRDTVGAGDAFTAALVAGLLRNDSLRLIAQFACEIAAATCAHDGAVPERKKE